MSISVQTAAQNNQLHVVRSLVTESPKLINAIDADERTALHWAASSGAKDIVRFLIDKDAQIDVVDNMGWSPLHIAVSAGHDEVVQELVGAGADVNKFSVISPISSTTRVFNVCFRKNGKGITPLHYAASKSRIDIGKLLISRGADINAKDNANQVPLHRAATTGSAAFINLLLNSSVPPAKTRLNNADRIGNTPLHLAMDSAHAEAAVILINAGADRTRTNLDGEMPEDVPGVGDPEQRRVKAYVVEACGPRE
ncbi:26s proteasome non-atpase regulatory subunit 10 [Mycena indigotica]|uniref:26s proteasome non-atpase regulatory subunit 10 n=1 Tax=Mycena indigotica TaxID=2126181 RepID=A0A8H6T7X9_9AGAR|nr:26s proteasome non-atpase regulatory subunit 10 [Mycena indigotica]KAF7311992.1 26s proteasome non-atpase regulatory subunit 10 [Mycena indigotica]